MAFAKNYLPECFKFLNFNQVPRKTKFLIDNFLKIKNLVISLGDRLYIHPPGLIFEIGLIRAG